MHEHVSGFKSGHGFEDVRVATGRDDAILFLMLLLWMIVAAKRDNRAIWVVWSRSKSGILAEGHAKFLSVEQGDLKLRSEDR